jgi:uncharacterized protein
VLDTWRGIDNMSEKYLIIDGHAHACGDYLTAESTLRHLDQNKVDKVVLVPGELNSDRTYELSNIASYFPNVNVVKFLNLISWLMIRLTKAVDQIPAGNQYVFGFARQCPERVIQFLWVTTAIEKPVEYLEQKYSEWGFSGVKLHQCWESFTIASPYFECVAGWAEAKGLPLFIHIWSDRQVSKLIDYKRKHPRLKLIVAHLFGLESFIKADYKDDNLFFDISSYQLTSNKRVLKAIDFVGAERILLGTDIPYGKDNLRMSIARVCALPIEENQKRKILGENMKNLLGI